MSNVVSFPLAEQIGLKPVKLRPSSRLRNDVWAEFQNDVIASVEAVKQGILDAPKIRGVLRKDSQTRIPVFFVDYGKDNYWFNNGHHSRHEGLDLVAHRTQIEWIGSKEGLEALKPLAKAKLEAEADRGTKAYEARKSNATIGWDSAVYHAANDHEGVAKVG